MKIVNIIIEVLIIIGALDIGSLGFLDFDFIQYALVTEVLSRVAYAIVGMAALYKVFVWCTGVIEKQEREKRKKR